ncbi:hypothetical protein ACIBEA_29915 [Streptomyces sp. NPDC051555]|uniref:hypothetical protein n=1 Tax=Streptomyces sp. NPDC051555 TaxID=3365657 RepID=UPI0037BBFC86
MSSWHEERRADKAAEARTARENKEHEAKLRRDERRRDHEEARAEKAQARRDHAARKAARAAKRQRDLTPANVYGKGTLILVAFSAAASLPAQIIHFVSLYWMLFPIGPAIEGLAWVMAAGVAYADEKKLAPWVRWLLRALTLCAAGFAGYINFTYGLSLQSHGLTADEAQTVGTGLAAVTMAGPVVFEIRQWVRTLTAAAANPARAKEKARARHEKKRRKDHKDVAALANRLVSARPFGELLFEEAFALAWEIKKGTLELGLEPATHAERHASRKAYAAALDAANGSPVSVRGRLLEVLHRAPASAEKPQLVTDLSPLPERAEVKAPKGVRGKPPVHRRTKGDALPFHDVAKLQHSHEARTRIAAVNGHHH